MNLFKKEFEDKFRDFACSRLADSMCPDAIDWEDYGWMLTSMQEFIDENYKEKE